MEYQIKAINPDTGKFIIAARYKTRAGAVNSMKKNFKSFKKGRVKVVYKK